jgi:glycosyltransferase involved in cell wall biosynthesis
VRVLIDYRPALREPSGAGEYTHQLVGALMALSASEQPDPLRLTLFSSSWKDRFQPGPELAGAAIVDRRVPVRLLNLAWHRLEWPKAETLTGAAFDVTHSSHPLLLPARAAARVITIHDLNFLTHPERTRAEVRRDYPALARAHAQRADRILVPSAFTAGEVERRLGVSRDRVSICPPGAPDWTPRSPAPKDGYVLFFSTLEPRKNVAGLLDAYERLLAGPAEAGHYGGGARIPDGGSTCIPYGGARIPDLVLAGRATDEAKPWLERLERPPLKGVVRHVGYVDRAERRALYEGARLLVQPSFEEGFGMAVLEAMTLGVPVVAANRGSLPEVLGDAGPLVNPDDPADIANGINRLLTDEALAAACASRGIERARGYRWHATARRVYDTYREAMERRGRSARSA